MESNFDDRQERLERRAKLHDETNRKMTELRLAIADVVSKSGLSVYDTIEVIKSMTFLLQKHTPVAPDSEALKDYLV